MKLKPFTTFTIWGIHAYRIIKILLDQVNYSVFGYVSYCKHQPSCSQYAIEQVRRYGTITGLRKGLQRIFSCY